MMTPVTRMEQLLTAIINGDASALPSPVTRLEQLVYYIAVNGVSGGTVTKILGVTTTPLSDGSTTNPIMIDGEYVTAEEGNLVGYGAKEFWYNANGVWDEFGDLTNVYSKSETDALLNTKADTSTTYTKSETDTLLSAKANSADVYTKTQSDNTFIAQADIDIKESPTTAEINAAIADIWGA